MNNFPIEEKARTLALQLHKYQKYGDHPYSKHLGDVVEIARKFELSKDIIAACWLHDTMEDCGLTVEIIERELTQEVAEMVFAVTDEPGENRKERKEKTYIKLAKTEKGIAVKLCDRIANLRQSIWDNNIRLIKMYLNEQSDFKEKLFRKDHSLCLPLWKELERWEKKGKVFLMD